MATDPANYFRIWTTWPIQQFTAAVEAKWLRELVQPGQSVLLAGSGGGREIAALLDVAGRLVALDWSQEMLQVGMQHYQTAAIEWRLGDMHDPPTDLTGFDHVVSLGLAWCYLSEPDRAARTLRDRLVAGGRLTVSVANALHPSEHRRQGHGRRAYTLVELTAQLAIAGYTVERVRGHRFEVDLLPHQWNREAAHEPQWALAMAAALAREAEWVDHRRAQDAKLLWVTARRGGLDADHL